MIVALMTLLLLGGGTTYLLETIDFYEDRMEDVIPEGERRNQAEAAFDAMEDSADRRHDAVGDVADQLAKLLQDTDVADADLEPVLAQYRDAIATYYREMIDHRFELKEHVTREEWQQIFSASPGNGGY